MDYRFVTFRKEGDITEEGGRNVSGKIWLLHNYCRTIYPMFLMTYLSENDDFMK
jgi:hypothetical protein